MPFMIHLNWFIAELKNEKNIYDWSLVLSDFFDRKTSCFVSVKKKLNFRKKLKNGFDSDWLGCPKFENLE